MQQTFNAKAQRCKGARDLKIVAVSLGQHGLVIRNPALRDAFVRVSLFQLCVLEALRLGVEFQLNRYG